MEKVLLWMWSTGLKKGEKEREKSKKKSIFSHKGNHISIKKYNFAK